jgi:hypothetical protein
MNSHRFLPVLLVLAPAVLTHCTANTTHPDPNNTSPAAAMTLDQPFDPATGNTAWGVVGQPMNVDIAMTQTGPGSCTDSDMDGYSEVCGGPNTPLAFDLTSLGCDDDQCDVTQIQVGTLTDAYGRPVLGDVVTLVPKSTHVTLRASGTSSSLTAAASLDLSVEGAN